MNELRKELPPLPDRVRSLPLDKRGYPVPWFVAWIDGEPDFRVIGPGKMVEAVKDNRCWICGQQLGVYKAFVLGPMCAVTRTTSEPPNHRDCAIFAATACPFLTRPHMKRSAAELPEGTREAAGFHLDRNPGATAVWITRTFRPFIPFAGAKGILYKVGDPNEVLWYANGRDATRAEVEESIAGGYPHLLKMAETDGPPAIAELEKLVAVARRLLPEAA